MKKDYFFRNNRQTILLEQDLNRFETIDEFEKRYSEEFLNKDTQIGDYLSELLYKYDKKAAAISEDAGLAAGYVGLIINGKRNNPKGQSRSYCVTLKKQSGQILEEAVKKFDDYLKECLAGDGKVEYSNRMISVSADNITYNFSLEAYKKSAQFGGCMKDGKAEVYLLQRMGIEQAIYRLKRYSRKSWLQNHTKFYSEEAIDAIKEQMADPGLMEHFPNHADRFIAIYRMVKEQYKWKSGYINGIL